MIVKEKAQCKQISEILLETAKALAVFAALTVK